jgi:sRNA-binding carbon storage regulator CsrA
MLILEANGDGTIIISLSDDSEIEIKIIELEGAKSHITIHSNETVSVEQKLTKNPD